MTILGDMTAPSTAIGGAHAWITRDCFDRKLSPVEFRDVGSARKRPYSLNPKCAATFVSPRRTCPNDCIFYKAGCYAKTGFAQRLIKKLDACKSSAHINDMEAAGILYAFRRGVPQDGAKGGRDLRLHVAGDVVDEKGARVLAAAAAAFKQLGGGAVWTYTRRWRTIPINAWGPISVLASVDCIGDAYTANEKGYFPAMVLPAADPLLGVRRCKYQTQEKTCVECRFCLDVGNRDALYHHKVLAFIAHGPQKAKASAAADRAMR